jgi:hypothetical protein
MRRSREQDLRLPLEARRGGRGGVGGDAIADSGTKRRVEGSIRFEEAAGVAAVGLSCFGKALAAAAHERRVESDARRASS